MYFTFVPSFCFHHYTHSLEWKKIRDYLFLKCHLYRCRFQYTCTQKEKCLQGFWIAKDMKVPTPNDNTQIRAKCPEHIRMGKRCKHFQFWIAWWSCGILWVKTDDVSLKKSSIFSPFIALNCTSLADMFILI